mgnify:CR=1 FL=1
MSTNKIMKNVVSFDLWNTLIQIEDKNRKFLTKTLSKHSHYNEKQIIEIVKTTGKYFDDLSIICSDEKKSLFKLTTLIENCKANISALSLESLISQDLNKYPPKIIDKKGLKILDEYFIKNSLGFIIASNSGFVSMEIMSDIISKLKIDKMKSFQKSFFSEDIAYAKPSKGFFKEIRNHGYKILLHVGDHPKADYDVADRTINTVLFDREEIFSEADYTKVKKIEDIIIFL